MAIRNALLGLSHEPTALRDTRKPPQSPAGIGGEAGAHRTPRAATRGTFPSNPALTGLVNSLAISLAKRFPDMRRLEPRRVYILRSWELVECWNQFEVNVYDEEPSFTELHIRYFQRGNPHTLRDFDELATANFDWNVLIDETHANLCAWNYQRSPAQQEDAEALDRRPDGTEEYVRTVRHPRFQRVGDSGLVFPGIPRPADVCWLWLTPTLRVLTIELCTKDKEHGWMYYRTEYARDWLPPSCSCRPIYPNTTPAPRMEPGHFPLGA
ncbi:hypothetical protein PG994_010232 [Apiospora phragmitis]|uniref:Uncharacterized protein n=1 Tax=Apiospora phragmitis TaxID=2905665 RepID=A0ABR1TPW3_9PEZI